MRAVVVSHGEVDPGDVVHVRGAELVVAADGGTEHLARWGVRPHLVIGDLDSLSEAAREQLGIGPERIEPWPREKDKTDTELAIERAISLGASEIVVVGALGGPRLDHALANTLLLAAPSSTAAALRLVRGPLSLQALRDGQRAAIAGTEGELVTLLAIGGDAEGVRSDGLRYELRGETLPLGSSRGVSNEVARRGASVSVERGILLVVEGGALPPQEPQPQ